ncbi:hypothetical protein FOA52_007788 [Chlamydomonas sp. UWO 241]|nr:hypothetical protein FOA52_007788 [Chlamydomonas sp. UWO 241]
MQCLRSRLVGSLPTRSTPVLCSARSLGAHTNGDGTAGLRDPARLADEPHSGHIGMSLVSEKQVYGRYLSVYDRQVEFTNEATGDTNTVDYDVVGHPKCDFFFTVVFPFHPAKDGKPAQVTLISEYCQGPNAMGYCLPSGQYDPKKHASIEDAARWELSEEALLTGGEVVRLIEEDHPGCWQKSAPPSSAPCSHGHRHRAEAAATLQPGMVEVKWCRNRFVPFLVISPTDDPNPRARDAEEHLMHVHRVDYSEFLRLITSGNMMLPSIATAFLGMRELKRRGLLPADDA